MLRRFNRIQPSFGKQLAETLGPFHAFGAVSLAVIELALDLSEPVSTVPGQFDPQAGLPLAQLPQPRFEISAAGGKMGPLGRKIGELPPVVRL